MKQLFDQMERALRLGEDVALVTVIASSGSVPRGAGARMLVSGRGLLAGTVGGGAVEHRCIAAARERLGTAHPEQFSFVLTPDDKAGLGMVCGGEVRVHILPVSAGDPSALALCQEAAEYFDRKTPFWLALPLQAGEMALWTEQKGLSADPEIRTVDSREWFVEQLQRPGRVYIFGGGHVAQALVPVLAPLDFPCVVVEDRAEFARRELFPTAWEVRLAEFSDPAVYAAVTENDYLCIMTRGHQNDLLVEEMALHTPARYIGLIGSVRKSAAAFAALREKGFSDGELKRIVTPIGLPLGGRTPAEIAISIAAQLIQHRSGLAMKERRG